MDWTLDDIIQATRGRLLVRPTDGTVREVFTSIGTDTRTLASGSVFIALKGERFDGHEFLDDAVKKGASAIIVERADPTIFKWKDIFIILVGDTRKALGELGRYRRLRFKGPVVGITGSNGKTSTKEMIASVLSERFTVWKTPGNWNNDIGVPLSIFAVKDEHTALVLELGINHPGEMTELVRIAQPTVGVITNIQLAHLEGFGSEDGVLREKIVLWRALPPHGLAVINRDDVRLARAELALTRATISFAIEENADVWVEGGLKGIDIDLYGTQCIVRFAGQTTELRLPVWGMHYVSNALASIATGVHFGISLEDAAKRLGSWKPAHHRMDIHRLPNGTIIVDDGYNANPGSMKRAIETVGNLSRKYGVPFVAVLGDMKELGEESEKLHQDVGSFLVQFRPYLVVTLGDMASRMMDGIPLYRWGGMCICAENHDHAALIIRDQAPHGAFVLVKGSRSMTMEKVIEHLLK